MGKGVTLSDGSAQRLWETALGQLEVQVTRPNFETWLRGTVGLRREPHVLTVGVASDFSLEWLRSRMSGVISRTVTHIAGDRIAVQFEVLGAASIAQTVEPATPSTDEPAKRSAGADPRFTFDSLAEVESNRLAVRAARRLADAADALRLLVVWSEPGLGKTHLLHAIAHTGEAAGLRIALQTGESFVRQFGNAVRSGQPHAFNARFTDLDVLLIDDLQFLAARKGSQEQFFHIFNNLQRADCRVAFTLDAAPKDVAGLSPRLLSRLTGGLCAHISKPDHEGRLAILKSKELSLPEQALRAIAGYPSHSVAELEGALQRVLAYLDLTGLAPSAAVISDALHPFQPRSAAPNHRAVLEAICSRFTLTPEDLSGPSRARDVTYARHLAMYFLHKRLRLPYTEIGTLLGGRDHTTALSGCRRIARESTVIPATQADIDAVDAVLSSTAA
jgi:chromosomal replication initiator protein